MREHDVIIIVRAAPYTTAQFPADNHFGAEIMVTLCVLPEPNVSGLYAAIQQLERLDDVRKLTALTDPQQKGAARGAKVAPA